MGPNNTKKKNLYLNLLKELTISDFKLRYNGSILGIFWSVLKPAAMLLVLYVIFGLVLNAKTQYYVLFLLLGIILWNFFVESTLISMHNILDKRSIIRSIYLPRHLLVLSSVLNASITLAINIGLFFVVFMIYGLALGKYALIFLLLLAMLFVLSLGVSYFLSAFYVRYRDILHIWEVAVQLGFWLTPIAYGITMIPQRYVGIYMLNPIASIITSAREVLIYNLAPSSNLVITALICIGMYILGFYAYMRMSRYFAEEL